tara:strand:- start:4349 stop:4624 length:276 start_codon:yes stop_codon:yes gene_type:complete
MDSYHLDKHYKLVLTIYKGYPLYCTTINYESNLYNTKYEAETKGKLDCDIQKNNNYIISQVYTVISVDEYGNETEIQTKKRNICNTFCSIS